MQRHPTSSALVELLATAAATWTATARLCLLAAAFSVPILALTVLVLLLR